MLNDFLGYLIMKSGLQIKFAIRQAYMKESIEITPEQWAILHALSENGEQTQKQLADTLMKQKPNITRLIDILEEKKLVMRASVESDRRAFNVYITEEGRTLAEDILNKTIKYRKNFYKKLTDEEIETLKSLLLKLTD